MVSLSSIPVAILRLPVIHAVLPALICGLLQLAVMGTCNHGLQATLVAALGWGDVLLVLLLAAGSVQREGLELMQFQVCAWIHLGGRRQDPRVLRIH